MEVWTEGIDARLLRGEGQTSVSGRLPPEVIQRIVRQNFGRFRLCYENGLKGNPTLQGRVSVKFVIDRNGAVASSGDGGSDLPDTSVVTCVVRGFGNLSFPQPEGGTVSVVYPIVFGPGATGARPSAGAADTQGALAVSASVIIGVLAGRAPTSSPGRASRRSGRERPWPQSTTASSALSVYRSALAECEAPSWRERSALLLEMVNRLGTVRDRVALWRSLLGNPAEPPTSCTDRWSCACRPRRSFATCTTRSG